MKSYLISSGVDSHACCCLDIRHGRMTEGKKICTIAQTPDLCLLYAVPTAKMEKLPYNCHRDFKGKAKPSRTWESESEVCDMGDFFLQLIAPSHCACSLSWEIGYWGREQESPVPTGNDQFKIRAVSHWWRDVIWLPADTGHVKVLSAVLV